MAAPAPYLNHISGPPVVDSKKVELNSLHRSTEISNTFVSYYMEGIWAAGHSSGLMAFGPFVKHSGTCMACNKYLWQLQVENEHYSVFIWLD